MRYYDKIHSKLPIFRVKSVKIYTRQFSFTQTPSVVSVTNKRDAGIVQKIKQEELKKMVRAAEKDFDNLYIV